MIADGYFDVPSRVCKRKHLALSTINSVRKKLPGKRKIVDIFTATTSKKASIPIKA